MGQHTALPLHNAYEPPSPALMNKVLSVLIISLSGEHWSPCCSTRCIQTPSTGRKAWVKGRFWFTLPDFFNSPWICSALGPQRCGENTFRVRWWKTGTFQILVSLAKALSRKQASLELSGGPGHFIATLWASFPGGSRCQNQEKDYKAMSQLLVTGTISSQDACPMLRMRQEQPYNLCVCW